jgi:uncharacterized membrane protein YphA (DoxX/SURF4 family)
VSFDWHIVLFARAFVALILLIGGITKLFDTSRFVEVVRSYRLLPNVMTAWAGRLLPIWEILLGVALLANLFPFAAAVSAALTFLVFGGAMAINLVRGRYYISCGCFGPNEERHVSWKLVISDVFFAGASLLSLSVFESRVGPGENADLEAWLTVLLAVVAVACWWLGGVILDVRRLPPIVVGQQAQDEAEEH